MKTIPLSEQKRTEITAFKEAVIVTGVAYQKASKALNDALVTITGVKGKRLTLTDDNSTIIVQ